MDIHSVIEKQRAFAAVGTAKDINFRKQQLHKLKNIIKENEPLLYQAIHKDIKKSKFETYLTELALIYHEIDTAIKRVSKWAKPKK